METNESNVLSSGISGLDSILHGGFPAQHAYLIKGRPGTGKTSLVMQFLSEGVRNDEPTAYVSFSESTRELKRVADAHDWPIDEMEVCDLASEISRRATAGSSIFHGAEVELPEVLDDIFECVERAEPTRLAIDSLTELRNLAESHRHYRRALFQLKVAFEEAGVTTLFVGEKHQPSESEAETVVHGVLNLEMETPKYGPVHRRLEVTKLRGQTYETGFHDFHIATGGLQVFPRIRPKAKRRDIGNGHPVKSGVEPLDELLGGGLDRGTTSLIIGPSGTGKSSVVMQYALAAAERDEKAVLYTFTEDTATIRRRAEGMELPLNKYLEDGHIGIRNIDAAEMSPGQFADVVREDVQTRDIAFVAIDSINGYKHAMPSERALVPHLHDLLTYLGGQGIIMMLVMTLSGLLAARQERVANLSYLADTILYLRYIEQENTVRKSITAVKHRTRDHEKLIRRFSLGRGGIKVGEPLSHVSNLLEEVPVVQDQSEHSSESEEHGIRDQEDDE